MHCTELCHSPSPSDTVPMAHSHRYETRLDAAWRDLCASVGDLCAILRGSAGTYISEWVILLYAPRGPAGTEGARPGRCRVAWVRAVA